MNTKEELLRKAQSHHERMLRTNEIEIENSINSTLIYGEIDKIPTNSDLGNPTFIYENTDSVSSVLNNVKDGKKLCLLNYASYKHPGGGFIVGAKAQEEMLCHESTLYEVIGNKKFSSYYAYNNEHKNRGLYKNRALYSPNILFERDDKTVFCDVITCAAPNLYTARRYQGVSKEENEGALSSRIDFIIDILNENNVDIFITGAFGCGVFRQDPDVVSRLWLNAKWGRVKKVIFAVPGENKNAQTFASYLND